MSPESAFESGRCAAKERLDYLVKESNQPEKTSSPWFGVNSSSVSLAQRWLVALV